MKRIYDYRRRYISNRNANRIIDLGSAGKFMEVLYANPSPADETVIDGIVFRSIHTIISAGGTRTFTAFRSDEEPSVLVIIWEGIPLYLQIEEGGDVMLQVMHGDRRVKHLIIDNTFVSSPWMDSRHTQDYMHYGWYPGLVQLELKSFCHLQAMRLLGKQSFEKFVAFTEDIATGIANRLDKKPFRYYPVRSSEMSADGIIDRGIRDAALAEALRIVRSQE